MIREPAARHNQSDKDRRLIALAALAVLALGTYVVLSPFLVSIAWAIILVLVTWPLYRLLRGPLQHRPGLAAGLMTLFLAIVIVVPVGFLVFAAVDELKLFVQQAANWWRADHPEIPNWMKSVPLVGDKVGTWVEDLKHPPVLGGAASRPGENKNDLFDFSAVLGVTRGVVGGVTEVLFKIAMCLFTAYFLYRHGEALAGQLGRVALQVGGPRYENLLRTIRSTVRAAVYGVLLTALAQGFLAGVGFFAVGAPLPLLLAAATVVASLIPFATPIVYLGAAGAMLAEGVAWWRPAGLALWGIAIVSTADNVIRPLFISQATQTPILLVFFGVIGGIVAFGLIGVILGPVILTVAMVLWKEWAQAEDVTSEHSIGTGHS
jgi:predicted PurR-regulated permease PerM